jgi:hypothetical protein
MGVASKRAATSNNVADWSAANPLSDMNGPQA